MVPFYQIQNKFAEVTKLVETENDPTRLAKIKLIHQTLEWVVQGEDLNVENLINPPIKINEVYKNLETPEVSFFNKGDKP